MATAEEPLTQLATRIPKELHRRLRVYCVTHDIVLMHFVAAGDCGEARTEARVDEADDLRRGRAFLTEPMTAIPFAATRDAR